MRSQAARCASFHRPVQPSVMRPSGLTPVASPITRPAPPTARLPRCTRCHSCGTPSTAEYWHMGETTTRFGSVTPRRVSGVSSGGRLGAGAADRGGGGSLAGEPSGHALDQRRVALAAGSPR